MSDSHFSLTRVLPLCLTLLAAPALVPAPRLVAQERIVRPPEQGQGITQDEILRRLAESGLSREEVKRRLRELGYDPFVVDPYFDRLDGVTSDSIPSAGNSFVEALRGVGLVGPLEFRRDTLTIGLRPGDRADTLGFPERSPAPGGVRVFGLDVFARPTTQFDALSRGPVDPTYRVAPGDEVILVVTGDAEIALQLRVDREGYVIIPDIGRVLVNGLTLVELEERLNTNLSRRLSGVSRGTTQVAVSLGELRTNQVFVIGEALWQGGYELSSLSTVFHALHEAGGPTEQGSFRKVQVRRDGEVVREIDLYRYLLEGDASDDIRLLQGDIVFVPLSSAQVTITGEVNREAIFELSESEGLGDVLAFAGGFRPGARMEQVHVYRILPPAMRTGALDRVLVDVPLDQLVALDPRVPVFDGDSVVVREVRAERANVVAVEGQVEKPGEYEFRSGMTLGNLIERSGGLLPDAFRPVAHVIRLNPADSTASLLRASLDGAPGAPTQQTLPLQDQDRVVIYGRPALEVPRMISVEGFVKRPGSYLLQEGMSVEDLVLAAGGFREGAQGLEAEVSRLRIGLERSDTISATTVVALTGTITWPSDGTLIRTGEQDDDGDAAPRGDEYRLEPGDRIFVRQLPGYVEAASVQVVGEVTNPGPYPVRLRDERLSSFIRRAGGITGDAHIEGARLVRDSILVGIDLSAALDDPGDQKDLVLEDGDRLEVPRFDPMVTILGAVAFESRVPYQAGWGLSEFLAQAGGALEDADRNRVSVEYPNGQRAISSKTLWIRRDPPVRPGSIIRVPYHNEQPGPGLGSILANTLSVTTFLVALLLAIDRL